MNEKSLQEVIYEIENFLGENYSFRRNLLSGKTEVQEIGEGKELSAWCILTEEMFNSILLKMMKEDVGGKSPKQHTLEIINSEATVAYDPIKEYLKHLPQWDGRNHVAELFNRIPGLTSEQLSWCCTWLRSAVAHWMGIDMLHGNEAVPVLIGAQGCGKTTFFKRLLPQHLRQYFLDHLNLSNKFDKEMALTNNLMVCLDELEAIRPSQHASLKQTLSKSKVNGRPIFGSTQEDKARYASFVATTKNLHPLTDATGSRRYICIEIPKGMFINNSGEIDYEQLYAQILHELIDEKAPYWFNNDEVARIQQLNQGYMEQKDIVEIIKVCFRKPEEGEQVKAMNTTELLGHIQTKFPTISDNMSIRVRLGQAMKMLEFDSTHRAHISYYKAIPLKSA